MIIESALNKIHSSSNPQHDFFFIILGRNHFIRLGAVGLDYPYLTHAIKNKHIRCHSWADRMHYENTGNIVRFGIEYLSKLAKDIEDFKVCLSWLCGYVSHLITDSVVHPVVNAIVGPYIFSSDEHRKCEMTQDSMIFKIITDEELSDVATADNGYAGYIDHLKRCSDQDNESRLNPALKAFWAEILKMNYPSGTDKFHDIDPDKWHENYISSLSTASKPSPFFRHVGEALDLIYFKTDKIDSDDRKKYFEEIKIPHKQTGAFNFKEHVFDKTVNEIVEVWYKLFVDIEKGDSQNCITHIKNWNLDTGVNEDDPFFWRQEETV